MFVLVLHTTYICHSLLMLHIHSCYIMAFIPIPCASNPSSKHADLNSVSSLESRSLVICETERVRERERDSGRGGGGEKDGWIDILLMPMAMLDKACMHTNEKQIERIINIGI